MVAEAEAATAERTRFGKRFDPGQVESIPFEDDHRIGEGARHMFNFNNYRCSESTVEFATGSFIPPGGDRLVDEAYSRLGSDCFWLITDSADAYEELGLDADDFDIIFAYPWPNEEHILEMLFQRYAADGALLLTYNQHNAMRLQRKASRRKSLY